MFSSLGDGFNKAFDRLKNRGSISESDLDSSLREIRIALLEADVALGVTKEFIKNIKEKAIGQKVLSSLTPSQVITKVVHDELIETLKDDNQEINLKAAPPAAIMLVGLQGVGKTTSSAKLAVYLRKKFKKKVLLVSLDVNRPAAQDQLETLAKQVDIDSLAIIKGQKVLDIVKRSMSEAKSNFYDIVLFDTAGRLHTNEELVDELLQVQKITNPIETLLSVDSMVGQDAVNSAKKFAEVINLTGIILTRVDADSRGGAALSVKYVTKCPIKFIGTGEKISDFEQFHPDRIASRILDMGDVVSLVEKAMDVVEEKDIENLTKKMAKGKFDMEDLRKQLKNMKKMGGLSSIMKMLPGLKGMKDALNSDKFDKNMLVRQEAIIDSMNKKERQFPKTLDASRKLRIAKGSGTTVQEINKLLKNFLDMQSMMKKMVGTEKKNIKNIKNFDSFLNNKLKKVL